MADPDLQIRRWGVGGGGLGEVLQEKEKRVWATRQHAFCPFS